MSEPGLMSVPGARKRWPATSSKLGEIPCIVGCGSIRERATLCPGPTGGAESHGGDPSEHWTIRRGNPITKSLVTLAPSSQMIYNDHLDDYIGASNAYCERR